MAVISVQEDGGGDFTTLAAALADAGTGAGDEINIEGAWDDPDTDECTVADDNITITALTGSKHAGHPHAGAETTYRLWTTGSGHSVTINNTGLTVDGLDIQNTSTGTSDEVFRCTASNPTFKNCVLGFPSRNSEQDIFYQDADVATTVNFENCMFYNAYRGCVDLYNLEASCVININSCSCYDIGFSTESNSRSGVIGYYNNGDDSSAELNIFNTFAEINTGSVVTAIEIVSGGTWAINLDRCISNVADLVLRNGAWSESATDCTTEATFTDNPEVAGVICEDVSNSPFDLRLQDDADNIAQDAHTDGAGANLTMPATDLIGTERPQNTNYDVGAFEIAVAGGENALPMAMNYYRQLRS